MMLCQRGCCYYSGVPMELVTPHSHWRVSLERVDNSLGYSKANCVLIAAEFNSPDYTYLAIRKHKPVSGSAQWSRQKVSAVHEMRRIQVDLNGLAHAIEYARQNPKTCKSTPGQRGPWTRRKAND